MFAAYFTEFRAEMQGGTEKFLSWESGVFESGRGAGGECRGDDAPGLAVSTSPVAWVARLRRKPGAVDLRAGAYMFEKNWNEA